MTHQTEETTQGDRELITRLLRADARAWRDQDPDDTTRAELDALISSAEAGDTEPLAERFASLGFLTLAVDLFGGKTAATLGPAMELVKQMKTAEAMEIIAGAVKLLASHSRGNSKVGITGSSYLGFTSVVATINPQDYGLPALFTDPIQIQIDTEFERNP